MTILADICVWATTARGIGDNKDSLKTLQECLMLKKELKKRKLNCLT